jgi:hypothetical protein
MANANSAFGLKPYMKNGSSSNSTGVGGYSHYEIKNDNSTAIYNGSVVIPLSTGFIALVGAADGGTVAPLGVFMGCEYVHLQLVNRFFQTTGRVQGQIQITQLKHS